MSAYDKVRSELKAAPGKWLVTGVGFIGSNLLEELLKLDQPGARNQAPFISPCHQMPEGLI